MLPTVGVPIVFWARVPKLLLIIFFTVSSSYMMVSLCGFFTFHLLFLPSKGSIYPWAPFVVFGLGALLAAAVTILLPETRGQTLPDTVADMEARLTEAHNG